MKIKNHFSNFKYIIDDKKFSANLLERIINKKSKFLLVSAMKTGKTTLVFYALNKLFKELDIQLIFISPKTSLLENLKEKYPKSLSCYGGQGVTLNGEIVATTPDSLHKVISACKEVNKKFYLVYDEIHECLLSYRFRRKLIRPIEAYDNNSLCVGLLGMTATPDNMHFLDWDYSECFVPKDQFIQANKLEIITNFNFTGIKRSENIAKFILKNYKKGNSLITRINDKKVIKVVKEILEKEYKLKVEEWYRAENEDEKPEGIETLKEMLSGVGVDFDIILTTSLVDVGVELYTATRKPIVIDFISKECTVIEDIQFIGRFREGAEKYIIVGDFSKIDDPRKLTPQKDILENLIADSKEVCEVFNKYRKENLATDPFLKHSFNSETEEYSYELDNYAILQESFKRYIQQILSNPEMLATYLYNHLTFNVNEYYIADIEEFELDKIEGTEEVIQEIKEQRKEDKKKFKELREYLKSEVETLRDREIEILITNPAEIKATDKWLQDSLGDLYDIWHSNDFLEYRKDFYLFKDNFKLFKNSSIKDILILVLSNKANKIKKQLEISMYTNMYSDGNKPINKRDCKRVYAIINEVNKKSKGFNIRNTRLSKKFKSELLETLQKEKAYLNLQGKDLDKLLSMVFKDFEGRIKGLKTEINLNDFI